MGIASSKEDLKDIESVVGVGVWRSGAEIGDTSIQHQPRHHRHGTAMQCENCKIIPVCGCELGQHTSNDQARGKWLTSSVTR